MNHTQIPETTFVVATSSVAFLKYGGGGEGDVEGGGGSGCLSVTGGVTGDGVVGGGVGRGDGVPAEAGGGYEASLMFENILEGVKKPKKCDWIF